MSNGEVLNRIQGKRTLLETIIKRKRYWTAHIISGKGILITKTQRKEK